MWKVGDHLKIVKFYILGVSLGTIICLQIRVSQPARILSVFIPGAILKLKPSI